MLSRGQGDGNTLAPRAQCYHKETSPLEKANYYYDRSE